jgi:hypothetical protein
MAPRSIGTTVLTLAAAMALTLSGGPAGASVQHPAVVSAVPAAATPHAPDTGGVNDDVRSYVQVGNVMYAGGRIGDVQNPKRTLTYPRHNLFAFDVRDGSILPFAPVFDGPVWTIVPAPDGTLIVGGEFTTVNGVARRGLVKLDATSGALVTTFNPPGITRGGVFDAQVVAGRLIVAGSFAKHLVALNPASGADTGYLKLTVSGTVADNAGLTKVFRFAVDPAGTRLVGTGNFTSVGGLPRRQAFMAVLGSTSVTMSTWYDVNLDKQCSAASHPMYLQDVDFAPDGTVFGFAATGYVPKTGDLGRSICDAAALYDAASTSGASRPKWINYTGGDTLLSIAITGAAVYVGGHQRWLDNTNGRDSAGPGAKSRPGIGAIDLRTGKALDWNPGKTLGVGTQVLYATPAGLWVGSDGRLFAGKIHDAIAFCPLP